MSLWHRAPREVYRVYGEDQYLEGETAPEGETALPEDTTAVEPDSRRVASWTAFAADVPPALPGTAGSPSALPGGSRAGRLAGVGLLVGVGLATLVLGFSNLSDRHGAPPDPVGQGVRVKDDQRVGRVARAGRMQAIARSVSSRQVRAPRFSAPPVRTPMRMSGSALRPRAVAGGAGTAPRPERAWSAALRAPGD
ncbi:MAG: hypothetical protein WAU42_04730, partial [Solirubrobacteraceae bacterium]